jgi:hypothetical protein
MNKKATPSIYTAIKTASAVAKKKAYRNGSPVAISKKGKIYLVYKNNKEIEVVSSVVSKSK